MSEPQAAHDPSHATDSLESSALREQSHARQLLVGCNAALRVLRLHNELNDAVSKPMASLHAHLVELTEKNSRVVLAVVERVFYFDSTRIRLATTQEAIAEQLAEEFSGRGIGGLSFENGIALEELITFFRVLDDHRMKGDFDALRATLVARGIRHAGVSKVLRPITESDAKKSAQDQAADVYVAAIRHVALVVGTKSGGSAPRSKRIIHELVDLAENDPVTLLALAGLRDTGSEESEHAVAVGALSIALGRRIGLDRNLLADLGIAALHHDAGLAEVGEGASGDLDRHPVIALKSILRFAPTVALFRQVLSALEHHRDFQGGGHPNIQGLGKPHLFSQIIRITNDFDGLTRGRRNQDALDVGEAVSKLQLGSGKAYNPQLLALFFDLIGGVETEPGNAPSPVPNDVDLMLAEFLGKSIEAPPPPPKPVSDVDLMLAAFLGKPIEASPSPPKPVNDVDLMLAEFLGKKAEPRPQALAAAAPAVKAPKKNALGAMKLKKVPRKKTVATV